MHRRRSYTRNLIFVIFLLTLPLANNASAEWKEKVLYSFQGIPDGAYPAGGVVFDKAGNLYGATTYGGANDCPGITQCGVVFQLQPPVQKGGAWSEHVLYVFKGVNSNDGDAPVGGVIFDQSGNLYGTTAYGGTGKCQLFGGRVGCGTVYELVPPKQKNGAWTEQVVYSFQSGKDGYFPWGDLTFDRAGNLYGATEYGGGYGSCNAPYYQYCGTVFKLIPPKGGKWTEQVLYSFKGVGAGKQFGDGANPNGGLVFDSKGAIYGTTYFGGNNVQGQCAGGSGGTGCGTVFKLSPPSVRGSKWTKSLLRRFDNQDGVSPAAGVVFDAQGQLYGSTAGGGGREGGVIFRLEPPKSGGDWKETVIHTFTVNGSQGCCVSAPLLRDLRGGGFYGAASSGGISESGVVFRIEPSKGGTWDFETGYYFMGFPDGGKPAGDLATDKMGNLYSTTQIGGIGTGCQHGGCGTVYEVSP